MKQRIRLTESEFHRIVKESVNRLINEINEAYFKQVDNLRDYILQNGLQMRPVYKFQRVNAQSGKNSKIRQDEHFSSKIFGCPE